MLGRRETAWSLTPVMVDHGVSDCQDLSEQRGRRQWPSPGRRARTRRRALRAALPAPPVDRAGRESRAPAGATAANHARRRRRARAAATSVRTRRAAPTPAQMVARDLDGPMSPARAGGPGSQLRDWTSHHYRALPITSPTIQRSKSCYRYATKHSGCSSTTRSELALSRNRDPFQR